MRTFYWDRVWAFHRNGSGPLYRLIVRHHRTAAIGGDRFRLGYTVRAQDRIAALFAVLPRYDAMQRNEQRAIAESKGGAGRR